MPKEKTIKTTLAVTQLEISREETVTIIQCNGCERTGELRRVEFTPPSAIGSPTYWLRLPDGWWGGGTSWFNVKATCPGCFETPPDALLRRAPSPEDED